MGSQKINLFTGKVSKFGTKVIEGKDMDTHWVVFIDYVYKFSVSVPEPSAELSI